MKETNIIDGRIIKFFPNKNGEKYKFNGINKSTEINDCPILIGDFNFKLYSGIIEMSQDPFTFCCKPEIGWFLLI